MNEGLGKRLLGIGVILTIPLLLLGGLLGRQVLDDMRFAARELLGLEYLARVVGQLNALTAAEGPISGAIADEARAAAQTYDHELGTQFTSAAHVSSMHGSDRSAGVASARALIADIGDKSYLILDPELESYYLMDILLLRIPVIFVETWRSRTAHTADTGTRRREPATRSRTPGFGMELELMRQNVQATEAVNEIRRALRTIQAKTGGSEQLARIAVLTEDLQSRLTAFGNAVTPASAGGIEPGDMGKSHLAVNEAAMALWMAAGDGLRQTLEGRYDSYRTSLKYSLVLATAVAGLALWLSIGAFRQIVSRLDDRIYYLAHRDMLTGLQNRAAITDNIDRALDRTETEGDICAVLLIDLDKFKEINDSHGHAAGDATLVESARRIEAAAEGRGIVGRLGGDEFLVVMSDLQSVADVTGVAQQICSSLRMPITVDGQQFLISSSIGIAVAPVHADTRAKLLECADMALYKAKAENRDQFVIFTRELADRMHERAQVEAAVRQATKAGGFSLAFQPQFDVSGRRLRGFEALLRLDGPDGKPIPPAVFVPVAEQLRLIERIGAWVIDRACAVAKSWPDDITVAVNLSPEQFDGPGLADIIASALRTHGLAPHRLEVEITENLMLRNTEIVNEELRKIRGLNVSIAMDDFGSGYSSMSYLLNFPFSKLKIDRSFIQAFEDGKDNAVNVLETIVVLGHRLQMEVIAEGVETLEQADVLNRLRCDGIQGFLYGRPVSETDVAGIILRNFRGLTEPAGTHSATPISGGLRGTWQAGAPRL